MPFREKAKNLFKTKSRGDSLTNTSTNDSTSNHDVYKPGEPMPPPKYRRPPQKEHKDKLESFSFSDAWRKRSFQSTHSPGGTRAPSRRTSRVSFGRKSVGRRSMSAGRTGSVTSGDTDMSGSKGKDSLGGAITVKLPPEPEQEGDDDVTNVGLSRAQSKENKPVSRPTTADGKQADGLQKTRSTAHDHQPFSEEDVATALNRSHLEVPPQSY